MPRRGSSVRCFLLFLLGGLSRLLLWAQDSASLSISFLAFSDGGGGGVWRALFFCQGRTFGRRSRARCPFVPYFRLFPGAPAAHPHTLAWRPAAAGLYAPELPL